MFDKEEFKDYHKPRVGVFKDMINDVINLVIFDDTFYRRVGLGKKSWIEENIFTDVIGWIWSWMNTINTNYTCIYYIIEFLNELYPNDRITMDKLCNPKTEIETLERIKTLMIKHKQEIFTPKKNGIFSKMFFIAQTTWNLGNISVIGITLSLNKEFKLSKINLNYDRGDLSDMNKGTDMVLEMLGSSLNNQSKLTDINKSGDIYISKNFRWNEKIYRNHVDSFTLECDKKIYFLKNSDNPSLIGINGNGDFFFHKSLLFIDPFEMSFNEFLSSLRNLLNKCTQKKIAFKFAKDKSNDNHIYFKNGRLILFLNNFDELKINETKELVDNQFNDL